MSPSQSLSRPLVAAVSMLSIVACLAWLAEPAQARERQVTTQGANGHGATRQVQRAGGDVSSSTTASDGKATSRSVDRGADGAQATVTGPHGNTRSRNSTRDGKGNGSTTVTRASGETATREVTRQP